MSFDHILLIGYGGPRRSDEVLPFLRAMSGGKNISEEQLQSSAQRYKVIGGLSPYHNEVMRFAVRLEKKIQDSGIHLPVFVGMKNWRPFLAEVLTGVRQKGHQKGLAIVLSAFPGAVAGARYKESLRAAQVPGLEYVFVEDWHDHELFIQAQAGEVQKTLEIMPDEERTVTPVVFTFHSLPLATGQGSYDQEARKASALVAKQAGHAKWSVAYQSRPPGTSGSWLGPDIYEVIGAMAKAGEKRVIVVPLGFFCDHVEILYDLDCGARRCAQRSGIEFLRAQTVIHHAKILALFKELIRRKLKA